MSSVDQPNLPYNPNLRVLAQANIRNAAVLVNVGQVFTLYTVPANTRARIVEVVEWIIVLSGAEIDFATLYILPSGETDLVTTAAASASLLARASVAGELGKNVHILTADRTASAASPTRTAIDMRLAAGDVVKVYIQADGTDAPEADDFVARYWLSGEQFAI